MKAIGAIIFLFFAVRYAAARWPDFLYGAKYRGKEPPCEYCGAQTKFNFYWDNRPLGGSRGVDFKCQKCGCCTHVILPSQK